MGRKSHFLLALALGVLTITLAASAADDVVFVLDASNSMNKLLAVKTRIDAAKDALEELVSGIGPGHNVGLMVYGHRINQANEVESCQDIELLFPVGPMDESIRGLMLSAIESITAQGKTPLADSLVTAANALAQSGRGGSIVLISDGEGNCGGQQLVVAQMIATMEPPISVHVIGLAIEPDAGESLQEIVTITGGSYWNVEEANGLLEALFALAGDEIPVSEPVPGPQDGIPAEYACFGITNVVYGTEGDDTLYGTPENDLIYGYAGDDFIMGLDGNDILIGGEGNDILEGGAGNDILDGGEGDDLLFGGAGDDMLCGGPGRDSLEGEAGNDKLDGGQDPDILLGGTGRDALYTTDPADLLMEGEPVRGSLDGCPVCRVACPPVRQPAPPVVPRCPVPQPCPSPVPQPPVCPVSEGAKVVEEGQRLPLHGTVEDIDCNVLQVLWEVTAGSLDDPTSLDPIYTAPMLDGCDDLEVCVSLTAVDSCGASASDSFMLHIRNVNLPPTAFAGREVCVNEGEAIVLPATATDPNGDVLSFRWSITNGGGAFEDPSVLRAAYVAPMIDACDGARMVLTLSVTDPCGAVACDSVIVNVCNVNRAPVVDLGPDFTINEGLRGRLTPVVSDPDCDDLLYHWTVTGGMLDNACATTPIFTAPMIQTCDGEIVTITLTVTDPCGLSATDSVVVNVANVNGPPTVELGPGAAVNEGGCLQLTPAVQDPDGDRLVYSWTVSGGTLSDLCAAAPMFTAPLTDLCEGETVAVTLTVTDPCGLTATDSMAIEIVNVNRPPRVIADP